MDTTHTTVSVDAADGGEALLCAFEALGVSLLVSSPGSEWSPLWEALARRKFTHTPAPTFIEVWHESVAVDIAIGYSLVSGCMAGVLLHATVGPLQGSIGILTALQMEVPMVVISGESVSFGGDPSVRVEPQWYGYLSANPHRVIEPIVKISRSVGHASTLYGTVVQSGEQALRSPQGPVFVGVPVEHLHAPWRGVKATVAVPLPRVQAAPDDLAAVIALLKQAVNPVIVVESAGRHPGAWQALIALAEAWGMPVIAGRSSSSGNFPTDHPLYLGGFGDYAALAESDLILLVSPRTPWPLSNGRPSNAPIVAIGDGVRKQTLLYQELYASRYLEGDVALTLAELARSPLPASVNREARIAKWTARHAQLQTTLAAARNEARVRGRLESLSLADALLKGMPEDCVVIDESVSHYAVLRHHLPMRRPMSYIRAPGGLGQGLSIAIGAKLAVPDRPVLCLVGDGAFLYNPIIQALGASRDHEAPLVIVVLNNHRYHVMREGLERFHYPNGIARATGSEHGSKITGFDYEKLAPLFGFHGCAVSTLSELDAALAEAFAGERSRRGVIINVSIDP